ncbi:MAG: hypothetical protein M3552_12060 [Planctomycetota bacterium]|nr:hypothetical protein [Planctomycetaceae bacterium]MDQ3331369.1 hypothetical protein [Planctomycetota bacterium]
MHQVARPTVLGGDNVPADVLRLIEETERRFQRGEPAEALAILNKSSSKSPWISNAIGVCHLRLHDARSAQYAFQSLASDGVYLRPDVPAVFRLNLALARLESGNLIGFAAALKSVSPADCPAVTKYREVFRRWRRSLSLGERLRFAFTGEAFPPLRLDFPPGELW